MASARSLLGSSMYLIEPMSPYLLEHCFSKINIKQMAGHGHGPDERPTGVVVLGTGPWHANTKYNEHSNAWDGSGWGTDRDNQSQITSARPKTQGTPNLIP